MHRVLVPLRVLEGETVPAPLVDLLAPVPVVVLGYHVLPEQTPPGQARMQFEERAQEVLSGLEETFAEAGGETETRLVFTHEEEQTIERVADETDCDAVLVPHATGTVEDVLVSLRGEVDPARVGAFVGTLLADGEQSITLFYAASDEADLEVGRERLTAARDALTEAGVATDRIETASVVSDAPVTALGEAAATEDLVVMGESAPSFRTYVFGEDHERVAERSVGPVLVLRREGDAEA